MSLAEPSATPRRRWARYSAFWRRGRWKWNASGYCQCMGSEEASYARHRRTMRFQMIRARCCAAKDLRDVCPQAVPTVVRGSGKLTKRQWALLTNSSAVPADDHGWGWSAMQTTLSSRKAVSPVLCKGWWTATMSGDGGLSSKSGPNRAVKAAEQALWAVRRLDRKRSERWVVSQQKRRRVVPQPGLPGRWIARRLERKRSEV